AASVGENNLDLRSAMHDVAVGEQEAIWCDEKAGPAAATAAVASVNLNLHHGRTNFLSRAYHGIGITIEQRSVVCRPGRGLRFGEDIFRCRVLPCICNFEKRFCHHENNLYWVHRLSKKPGAGLNCRHPARRFRTGYTTDCRGMVFPAESR